MHRAPFAILLAALLGAASPGVPGTTTHIGDRLELFVDEALVAARENLAFTLHPPRAEEIALRFDRPWEGPASTYVTVFRDGEKFRMYYRGLREGQEEVTCYAESRDGIAWHRPSLGLHEWQGSRENNIVWRGRGAHNFAPFRDERPGVPEAERYKALAGGPLLALVSADGLRWRRLREEPVLTKGAFDSQNLAFWDSVQGRYACYFRVFVGGVRAIARSTSPDFLQWSEPAPIDLGPGTAEHLYTNATVPYFRAPHFYLAFPMRFQPGRKLVSEHRDSGVSDALFMSSRDGARFDRRFREAFIRPGRDRRNWTDRNQITAWGLLPTAPDELSLYWGEHYRHPDARLRRGVVRTDGFVSLRAPHGGGELTTKPVEFAGRELVLNYATSAAGGIRVEVQDEAGRPLPGYSLAEAQEVFGDEIEGKARWKGGEDVSRLSGRPVRLRFVLRDADLYSYRFRR